MERVSPGEALDTTRSRCACKSAFPLSDRSRHLAGEVKGPPDLVRPPVSPVPSKPPVLIMIEFKIGGMLVSECSRYLVFRWRKRRIFDRAV